MSELSSFFDCRGCVFSGNTATSTVSANGGAISMWGGALSLSRCIFTNNVATGATVARGKKPQAIQTILWCL
jgi:hypothetical protein